jgi:predicted amidohydrolase
MRIAAIQLTAGLDAERNRLHIASALSEVGRTHGQLDLVVLPEASQRGFGPPEESLAPVAESLQGPFVSTLTTAAADLGAVVVGGMFEAVKHGHPYNTLVAVGPEGIRSIYRKTHLYDAFGQSESDRLQAGPTEPAVVDLGHSRVGLMTCYDLRFPEQARVLVDAGADVVVVPAAWWAGPHKVLHWRTLLTARAIENTVWVAGVGQAGSRFCGSSLVLDPAGEVAGELGSEDGVLVVDVDLERVAQVRLTNPSLANRRWQVVPLSPPTA